MIRVGGTEQGELRLDIARLVDSRMLIQANSGGGKSWLMRLIAERAAKHIPVFVIDYEGEFSSLREAIDLVLVGSQGEIPADVRSAGLLARKLVELEVSAVLDIYELKPHDRRMYVKAFLESLLALPRSLWKPVLIMIDEAHKLCPQSGSQKDYASTQSVIDLMSMGGKRGFCGVLATQRFSKIHNDAIAEANNVFIGRTWLKADQTRAAEYLGLTTTAERTELRAIEQGNFYAFGPALSPSEVTLVHTDEVKTTHPRGTTARLNYTPPVASRAVQEIASKLADLPKQAEAEIKNLDDAKRKIAELEKRLRSHAPVVDERAIERAVSKAVAARDSEWSARTRAIESNLAEAKQRIEKIAALARLNGHAELPPAPTPNPVFHPAQPRVAVPPTRAPRTPTPGDTNLGKGERAILTAVAQHTEGVTREQLTVLTGYKRSSRDTYLQRLSQQGYTAQTGDNIKATGDGLAALGPDFEPLPTGDELLRYWLERLSGGEQVLLAHVAHAYPGAISRQTLSDRTDYKRSSRDTYLQRLAARRLILPESNGMVRASEMLFG